MGKGQVGERTIFIIGGVIFFVIAMFILFKIFPNVYGDIMMWLGVIKPTIIEQAMLCSYHRCADGCMSGKVQEISWKEEGKDKPTNCQDFCQDLPDDAYTKDFWGNMEPQLKVCNENYPVNITLDKKNLDATGTLNKDHITDIDAYTTGGVPHHCIVYPGVDWTGINPTGDDSYVYVRREQLTNIKEWYCIDETLSHLPAIQSATLKPGEIVISAHRGCPQGAICFGDPMLIEITVK